MGGHAERNKRGSDWGTEFPTMLQMAAFLQSAKRRQSSNHKWSGVMRKWVIVTVDDYIAAAPNHAQAKQAKQAMLSYDQTSFRGSNSLRNSQSRERSVASFLFFLQV